MSSNWIEKELSALTSSGLLRQLRSSCPGPGRTLSINNRTAVDFGSNDYLGLRNHPDIIAAAAGALQEYGMGGGASRLISGNHPLYGKLENEIALFKKYPAALVFNSGYSLNLSVIPALAGKGDAVIMDRLNHASLIDGAKLSGARLLIYPHVDMNGLEKALKAAERFKKKLIVTDTVFSMDGDIAPLMEIRQLAQRYGAMVFADEAHATGVLGPGGRGAVEQAGLSGKIEIVMGTFSKALGSLGAYLVCSPGLKSYLVNTARGLVYTTALPPAVLAASSVALKVALRADGRRKKLEENRLRLRQGLYCRGFDFGKTVTPIIPVIFKDEKLTVRIAEQMLARGYYAPAIRFPAVKKGQARLRVALSSGHSAEDIDGFLDSLGKVAS